MRMIGILLLTLGGAYVGLCTLLFLMQSRLLHLPNIPSRELVATPADVDLDYETVALVTADGVRLHGWFLAAPQPRATLLFFHGNAGNISHRLESLLIFNRLGLNTLIFDYRGYGQSGGTVSEKGIYEDATAALAYLREQRGIPLLDLVFYGHSLGGAVAAWLAARHPPGALIIESSFTSVRDIAADLYPFFPTLWLTRLGYDTLVNLQAVCSPVLIIHSPDDEIIPFRHAQQLFAAAREPKRFLQIRGDHNSGFLLSGQRYEQGIADFLSLSRALQGVPGCPEVSG